MLPNSYNTGVLIMTVAKKRRQIGVIIAGLSFLVAILGASLVLDRLANDSDRDIVDLGRVTNSQTTNRTEQSVIFSDPAIKKNWGLLSNIKATISAKSAWEITKGDREIIVAVIDTGIDIHHPDIKNNLWKNKGETGFDAKGNNKATNGIDDDNNGYIDDVHGWNFVHNDHELKDNHGHGTHIAGIVGAEGGNGIGISGVAPKVSLMILKYYDPKAKFNDNLRNTIKSIHYATKMKAHIINYSGGGLDYSREEYMAVKKAKDKGILFVAAAGNEKSNSDIKPYYPADYNLDNIISVTAINPKAQVLHSSNFGNNSVHIAAPGKDIFSTLPNGRYGHMTGTSQATAFVSGVASLILAKNKSMKYTEVRTQILKTADELPGLKGKTKTSGKLNSWAALAISSNDRAPTGAKINHDLPFYNETVNDNNLASLSELANALRKPVQSKKAKIPSL